MARGQIRRRRDTSVLPLFSPALHSMWQIVIPRNRLVVYVPERGN